MEIIIRPYEEKDEQAFRQATIDLQNYECTFDPDMLSGEDSDEAWFKHIMEGNKQKDGQIYIADADGEAVGFICLQVELKGQAIVLPSIKSIEISGLIIHPEFRGKGVGKLLLQKAEEYAKERNIPYVKLSVFAANTSAREVYKHFGFDEYNITMVKKVLPLVKRKSA